VCKRLFLFIIGSSSVPLPLCIRDLSFILFLGGSTTGIINTANAVFISRVLHSLGIDIQERKVLVIPLFGSRPEGREVV
jgi:hypothetical protein